MRIICTGVTAGRGRTTHKGTDIGIYFSGIFRLNDCRGRSRSRSSSIWLWFFFVPMFGFDAVNSECWSGHRIECAAAAAADLLLGGHSGRTKHETYQDTQVLVSLLVCWRAGTSRWGCRWVCRRS